MPENNLAELDKTFDQYLDNYEAFAKDCISIRDHNTNRILPLIFNKGERILHIVSEKMKAEKGIIRIMLLKSRRFGGSTYIEGRFYWKTSLNYNRNTFIVGHEVDSTATLYTMARLMQEQDPFPAQTRKSNADELVFDNEQGTGLKSQYRLATAKNVHAGKSQGIHYLHASEEAMWERGGILLSGLLQCVPDPPSESEVYRESTANGYGNSFQEDVFKSYAEGKFPYYQEDGIIYAWTSPQTEYILVFIPWFVHERYVRKFDNEEAKTAFIERLDAKVFNKDDLKWEENEAKRCQKKFNLSLEQLYWREWAIENKCRGSIDVFHENYPSSVEEAFLSSGTNVFGQSLCDDLEGLCEVPILVGDVVDRLGQSKVKPQRHGKFSLWEKPDHNEVYFMTIDSGGGIKESQKEEGREPDPTCIDVYNHRTGKQVAQWHGHIDYDLIGDIASIIGWLFYRQVGKKQFEPAKACVELNNHGYTVVADLKRKHYPMYCAKKDEPGWITSIKTKPQMVDSLYKMGRDGGLQIRCKQTVSEMRTFIEEGGKYNAASGCHDERVDCAAMASQMMILLPIKYNQTEKNEGGIMNWRRYIRQMEDKGEYREVTV